MGQAIRFAAYVMVVILGAGGVLCVLAIIESRKPKDTGEILMLIPGSTIIMFFGGIVLGCCVYIGWHKMNPWERLVLGVCATFGVGLFPVLYILKPF